MSKLDIKIQVLPHRKKRCFYKNESVSVAAVKYRYFFCENYTEYVVKIKILFEVHQVVHTVTTVLLSV
jgi:hypothetical protein